jgi:hypothetical protein
VLSLDDDILMPCSTIEAAFARWRAAPQQLLGFYPRLLLPEGDGQQALQARKKGKSRRRGKHVAGTGSGGSDESGAGGSGGTGEAAAAALPVQPAPVYHFEEFVFQTGQYNAILAGAAFMDSAALFPAYFSAAAAPARSLVDEVFNCDDLLLNFVAGNLSRAAATAPAAGAAVAEARDGDGSRRLGAAEEAAEVLLPPVQLMRPQRRIDLSRMSGVGECCCQAEPWGACILKARSACLPTTANCLHLHAGVIWPAAGWPHPHLPHPPNQSLVPSLFAGISHNPARFKAAADRCLAEFSQLFGGSPLQVQQVPADYGSPPNCHLWPFDCMYLSDK